MRRKILSRIVATAEGVAVSLILVSLLDEVQLVNENHLKLKTCVKLIHFRRDVRITINSC